MTELFADLHIHLGCSGDGSPIKITAAKDLTFANVIEESVSRKGMDLVGIVDCASPKVLKDIGGLLKKDSLHAMAEGGLRYKEKVTVILGAEVETAEENGGSAHGVAYFPFVEQMEAFSLTMGRYIKNPNLSTQKARITMAHLFEVVKEHGGILVPAHVFTPHKSVYGSCASRLKNLVGDMAFAGIKGIELGLSADSNLADHIDELGDKSFLTNSDAHSLPKIGREYNVLELAAPNFRELDLALKREAGRRVARNYGLDPRLGKYHRTHCLECDRITEDPPPVLSCPYCGSFHVVKGVLDRISEISDYPEPRHPGHRPPYIYQVPLQFLPKVGPKTLNKLLARFGTEMNILHRAPGPELVETAGPDLTSLLLAMREGSLRVSAGGGGRYGKVTGEK